MNQKMKAFVMVILCIFGIAMTGKIVLDEKEVTEEDVVINSTDNLYVCAGVSRTMADALENAGYNNVYLEEKNNIQVKSANYEEESESEIMYEEVPVEGAIYVYADLLNLRAGANTDSEVLTVLSYGTEVQVIGEMSIYMNDKLIDHWTHVNYEGQSGYLKSDYLIDEPPYYFLGTYDITYYCPCAICCNVETGITASGAVATAGITCAADSSIPFGTELIIDGHTYIVQDRGGAIKGNHIDIFCNTHEEALSKSRHNAEVYMKIDID